MTGRAGLAVAAVVVAAAALRAQGPPAPTPLPTGSTIVTGRIVDADTGAPIGAAGVAIAVAGASGRAATERVLTDARGRFFFSGVGTGSFTLTASKPGWIEGAAGRKRPEGPPAPVELRDGTHPAELVIPLWRYAVVAGRVIDEQAEPLPGTEVRIFRGSMAAGRRQWSFVSREITDDRGIYRFSELLPGAYLVVVPAAVSAEPAALRGPTGLPTSYYQTMSPIGAAPMTFEAARIPAAAGSLVTSIFSLPGPPTAHAAWLTYPTTYFPSATALGLAQVVDAVSGRERAGVDISMRPVPTFTVSGTLSAPGDVAPGFHAIHLLPADSADRPLFDVATAVTDSGGHFTFYGVPAGQYIARIVRVPSPGPGYRIGVCGATGAIRFVCLSGPPSVSEPLLHAQATVTVEDRHVSGVVLNLRPGVRLSGRVEFEGVSPRPTAAVWRTTYVSLDPAGGHPFKAAGGFEMAPIGAVDEAGRFSLSSAWPARYVVRIDTPPQGWRVKSVIVNRRDAADTPLDLDRDIDDAVVTFTDRMERLSGTVRTPTGQPDEAASVLLFPADPVRWTDYGRSTRRVRMIPTAAGEFSTPAPPEGDYLLIALPESQLVDWQNPAFLRRAAALADHVTIREGQQPVARTLQTRSLP